MKKLKVTIVNYEEGRFNGILSKFAYRMKDELIAQGHKAKVSVKPDKKADVNHHINYAPYNHANSPNTINTLMVTHITNNDKFHVLKNGMKTADCGVCMSEDTQKLLEKGNTYWEKLTKLTTVLPAHDSPVRRPKIVSILTNVYPDGCKRQGMFLELLQHIDKKKFVFMIMGTGWERELEPLMSSDAQVQLYTEFDRNIHKQLLDLSDYCLYFGKDEGSMAILDAAQCGVKTIAPEVGFHNDIGIDFPFDTQEELNAIFDKLSYNPVEDWTFDNYVKQHVKLWEDIAKKKKK